MTAFVAPPTRIPFYLRLGLRIARRWAGVDLLPPQLLAWYPRTALSSAVLEALRARPHGQVSERTLKLVRMTVSFTTSCPFCMGLNSAGWSDVMTDRELGAVQGRFCVDDVASFSAAERLAIRYARLVSATPLAVPSELGDELLHFFSEKEVVVLASAVAQVNYWARLIQALGCPRAG